MLTALSINHYANCTSFIPKAGTEEYYFAVHCNENISFSEAIESIHKNYLNALKEKNLTENTQIFTRIFLSDISNQKEKLNASELFKFISNGAYSIIQQCPLNSGPISIFSYHIREAERSRERIVFNFDNEHWRNGVKVTGKNYDMYWACNFSGLGQSNSFEQTNEIFSSFNLFINDNGLTLLNNTVRTWIYVRDVDNNYKGMVDARRDYFYIQGLSPKTRYIASTGIEAKMKEYYSLVSMDALSISRLKQGQIVRMEAPENLCPTEEYGVTFERGTKIVFGDRCHMHISGTASIDKYGKVLYPSDIVRQTERTLDNIQALLSPHNATLDDMAYLMVYLRNIKEAEKTIQTVNSRLKHDIPLFVVQAPVCRPAWLVEIEGVAVTGCSSSFPLFI